MGRARNPNRDKAQKLWSKSNGDMLLKDIAARLDVSASTVRKWKAEDNWEQNSNRSAPKKIKERSDKLRGNRNAVGNNGGPPQNNKNAVTHGFFANWLPEETQQIVDAVAERSPADIIWDQVQIQYAAIMRAQKIMYVADANDFSNEPSGYTDGTVSGETYKIQYAWEKQANFMAAQSRAMGTLSNLIRQFVALAADDDERKQRAELLSAQVKRAKADADVAEIQAKELKGEGYTNPILEGLAEAAKQLMPQPEKEDDKHADTDW